MSHAKAYRTFLETGADAGLVLEDNARLRLDILGLVGALAERVPRGAHVVLLSFAAIGPDLMGPLRSLRIGIELPEKRELLEVADLVHAHLSQ